MRCQQAVLRNSAWENDIVIVSGALEQHLASVPSPVPTPPADDDWRHLIEGSASRRPSPISTVQYLGKWDSAAGPAKVLCSDGRVYVAKGVQFTRRPWLVSDTALSTFNDLVATQLGRLIGAPVPDKSALILISAEFIAANDPALQYLTAGIASGARFIEGMTEKSYRIKYLEDGDNRSRFASLAIFFGWMGGHDRQFNYRNTPPRLVYSVDHGDFFHGGRYWTPERLELAPRAEAYYKCLRHCGFADRELIEACEPLLSITPEHIAAAVAMPPDSWGVGTNERVALAKYIDRRRLELIKTYL
jgi:hypothetical protein